MARSSVFRTVRRWLRRAHAANQLGLSQEEAFEAIAGEKLAKRDDGPTRRSMLIGTLSAAALVPFVNACSDDEGDSTPRIAIIGGGIAGLTVAHFLTMAGVRFELYEASERLGGRMYTDRDSLADSGQLVELGGELVDSDHIVIQSLCHSFGFELDDLAALTEGLAQDSFYFRPDVMAAGTPQRIMEADIITAFMPVAAIMQEQLPYSEEEDDVSLAEFERIDQLSIPAWLEQEAGLPATSMIRRLLEIAYLEEFGLEVAEQSAWNLITLIDSETIDPFHVFGDSDERYHIHAGNDALPLRMAQEFSGSIRTGHALTKVAKAGSSYRLTFSTSAGDTTVDAAHVVYALPFTKLREVDLAESELSEDKLQVIDELGYGTNAKLMMQFTDRHWEDAPHDSSGGLITDAGDTVGLAGVGSGLQSTWATSRGQDGERGILTNFVGGQRGIDMGSGTPESQAQTVLPWIEQIWPGIMAKYVPNSAVRMHWPTYELTKGSYSSYKVGQWVFYGLEGAREENQHFCGEHTSGDYQGYMEGGAESGLRVATEILDDLGISYPPVLAGIIDMQNAKRVKLTAKAELRRLAAAKRTKQRGLPLGTR